MNTDSMGLGVSFSGKPEVGDGAATIALELVLQFPRKVFDFTKQEHRILWAVLLHTYGHGRDWTDASISQLARDADMRPNHAGSVINELVDRNVLKWIQFGGSGKVALKLNKYYLQWVTKEEWTATRSGKSLESDRLNLRVSEVLTKDESNSPEHDRLTLRVSDPSLGGSYETRTPVDLSEHDSTTSESRRSLREQDSSDLSVSDSTTSETRIGSFPHPLVADPGSNPHDQSIQPAPHVHAHAHARDMENNHVSNIHDLSHERERSHVSKNHGISLHAHAHAREDGLPEDGLQGGVRSRPGGRKTSEPTPEARLIPPHYSEAFPGELDWLLSNLGVRSYSEFGNPAKNRSKQTFDKWCSYPAEKRAQAYKVADAYATREPLSYALSVLRNPKKEVLNAATRQPRLPGVGPERNVPARDWNSLMGRKRDD